MATTEGRLAASIEALANQLNTMNERINSVECSLNERLNDIRTWLIALTILAGAILAALVTLVIVWADLAVR
jgi:hypothetical protein